MVFRLTKQSKYNKNQPLTRITALKWDIIKFKTKLKAKTLYNTEGVVGVASYKLLNEMLKNGSIIESLNDAEVKNIFRKVSNARDFKISNYDLIIDKISKAELVNYYKTKITEGDYLRYQYVQEMFDIKKVLTEDEKIEIIESIEEINTISTIKREENYSEEKEHHGGEFNLLKLNIPAKAKTAILLRDHRIKTSIKDEEENLSYPDMNHTVKDLIVQFLNDEKTSTGDATQLLKAISQNDARNIFYEETLDKEKISWNVLKRFLGDNTTSNLRIYKKRYKDNKIVYKEEVFKDIENHVSGRYISDRDLFELTEILSDEGIYNFTKYTSSQKVKEEFETILHKSKSNFIDCSYWGITPPNQNIENIGDYILETIMTETENGIDSFRTFMFNTNPDVINELLKNISKENQVKLLTSKQFDYKNLFKDNYYGGMVNFSKLQKAIESKERLNDLNIELTKDALDNLDFEALKTKIIYESIRSGIKIDVPPKELEKVIIEPIYFNNMSSTEVHSMIKLFNDEHYIENFTLTMFGKDAITPSQAAKLYVILKDSSTLDKKQLRTKILRKDKDLGTLEAEDYSRLFKLHDDPNIESFSFLNDESYFSHIENENEKVKIKKLICKSLFDNYHLDDSSWTTEIDKDYTLLFSSAIKYLPKEYQKEFFYEIYRDKKYNLTTVIEPDTGKAIAYEMVDFIAEEKDKKEILLDLIDDKISISPSPAEEALKTIKDSEIKKELFYHLLEKEYYSEEIDLEDNVERIFYKKEEKNYRDNIKEGLKTVDSLSDIKDLGDRADRLIEYSKVSDLAPFITSAKIFKCFESVFENYNDESVNVANNKLQYLLSLETLKEKVRIDEEYWNLMRSLSYLDKKNTGETVYKIFMNVNMVEEHNRMYVDSMFQILEDDNKKLQVYSKIRNNPSVFGKLTPWSESNIISSFKSDEIKSQFLNGLFADDENIKKIGEYKISEIICSFFRDETKISELNKILENSQMRSIIDGHGISEIISSLLEDNKKSQVYNKIKNNPSVFEKLTPQSESDIISSFKNDEVKSQFLNRLLGDDENVKEVGEYKISEIISSFFRDETKISELNKILENGGMGSVINGDGISEIISSLLNDKVKWEYFADLMWKEENQELLSGKSISNVITSIVDENTKDIAIKYAFSHKSILDNLDAKSLQKIMVSINDLEKREDMFMDLENNIEIFQILDFESVGKIIGSFKTPEKILKIFKKVTANKVLKTKLNPQSFEFVIKNIKNTRAKEETVQKIINDSQLVEEIIGVNIFKIISLIPSDAIKKKCITNCFKKVEVANKLSGSDIARIISGYSDDSFTEKMVKELIANQECHFLLDKMLNKEGVERIPLEKINENLLVYSLTGFHNPNSFPPINLHIYNKDLEVYGVEELENFIKKVENKGHDSKLDEIYTSGDLEKFTKFHNYRNNREKKLVQARPDSNLLPDFEYSSLQYYSNPELINNNIESNSEMLANFLSIYETLGDFDPEISFEENIQRVYSENLELIKSDDISLISEKVCEMLTGKSIDEYLDYEKKYLSSPEMMEYFKENGYENFAKSSEYMNVILSNRDIDVAKKYLTWINNDLFSSTITGEVSDFISVKNAISSSEPKNAYVKKINETLSTKEKFALQIKENTKGISATSVRTRNGEKVSVIELDGAEFNLIGKVFGAYRRVYGDFSSSIKEAQQNTSTYAFGSEFLGYPSEQATDESIVYGFDSLPEHSILNMGGRDLRSGYLPNTNIVTSLAKEAVEFLPLNDLYDQTMWSYNEIVVDIKTKKFTPSYLIYYYDEQNLVDGEYKINSKVVESAKKQGLDIISVNLATYKEKHRKECLKEMDNLQSEITPENIKSVMTKATKYFYESKMFLHREQTELNPEYMKLQEIINLVLDRIKDGLKSDNSDDIDLAAQNLNALIAEKNRVEKYDDQEYHNTHKNDIFRSEDISQKIDAIESLYGNQNVDYKDNMKSDILIKNTSNYEAKREKKYNELEFMLNSNNIEKIKNHFNGIILGSLCDGNYQRFVEEYLAGIEIHDLLESKEYEIEKAVLDILEDINIEQDIEKVKEKLRVFNKELYGEYSNANISLGIAHFKKVDKLLNNIYADDISSKLTNLKATNSPKTIDLEEDFTLLVSYTSGIEKTKMGNGVICMSMISDLNLGTIDGKFLLSYNVDQKGLLGMSPSNMGSNNNFENNSFAADLHSAERHTTKEMQKLSDMDENNEYVFKRDSKMLAPNGLIIMSEKGYRAPTNKELEVAKQLGVNIYRIDKSIHKIKIEEKIHQELESFLKKPNDFSFEKIVRYIECSPLEHKNEIDIALSKIKDMPENKKKPFEEILTKNQKLLGRISKFPKTDSTSKNTNFSFKIKRISKHRIYSPEVAEKRANAQRNYENGKIPHMEDIFEDSVEFDSAYQVESKMEEFKRNYADIPDQVDILELKEILNHDKTIVEEIKQRDHNILYKSLMHGEAHTEKTYLYGCLIGESKKYNDKEMKLLKEGLWNHDIGRTGDSHDEKHGKNGAEKYINMHGDTSETRELAFLIEGHNIDSSISQPNNFKNLFEKYDISSNRKIKLLDILGVIKDADALDRARLSQWRSKNSLKVNYLSNDTSKRMLKLSLQLNNAYYLANPKTIEAQEKGEEMRDGTTKK